MITGGLYLDQSGWNILVCHMTGTDIAVHVCLLSVTVMVYFYRLCPLMIRQVVEGLDHARLPNVYQAKARRRKNEQRLTNRFSQRRKCTTCSC